jgi:hypothetical protein
MRIAAASASVMTNIPGPWQGTTWLASASPRKTSWTEKAGVTGGEFLGASRPVSSPPVERKRATPSLKGFQVATTFPRPLAAKAAMDLHRRAANNLEEAKAPPKTGMSLRRLSSRFSRPSG